MAKTPNKTASAQDEAAENKTGAQPTKAGSAGGGPTAAQDPAAAANAAIPQEERQANQTHAEQDQKAGRPKTQLEAAQEAAILARRAATDATVSPAGSTTIVDPDAELRADMTDDALAVHRAQLREQARAEGGGSAERLAELADQIAEAQKAVNEAVANRDRLRDEYDVEVEKLSADAPNPASVHVDYIAAQNARREEIARQRRAQTGEPRSAAE